MKVTSKKPVGQRMFKPVKEIHTVIKKKVLMKRPIWVEPIGKNWWFDLDTGEWVQGYNGKGNMSTSYYAMEPHGFKSIWSLKAAKRTIANWDVPKGTWFRVALPYVGYTFKIRKS